MIEIGQKYARRAPKEDGWDLVEVVAYQFNLDREAEWTVRPPDEFGGGESLAESDLHDKYLLVGA